MSQTQMVSVMDGKPSDDYVRQGECCTRGEACNPCNSGKKSDSGMALPHAGHINCRYGCKVASTAKKELQKERQSRWQH